MTGSIPPSIEGCVDACRRCRILVEFVRSADPTGSKRAYSAIGPHLRHCVDHLHCLLRGLATGTIDYDARDREAILEVDPGRMLERLSALADELRALDPATCGRTVRLRQTTALGASPVTLESNVERELVFLSGHTIHHIAIMTLLVRDRGIAVPAGLDVAFSTAAHADAVGS